MWGGGTMYKTKPFKNVSKIVLLYKVSLFVYASSEKIVCLHADLESNAKTCEARKACFT